MSIKSEVFDDATAPPLYGAISTSAPADSIQCRQPCVCPSSKLDSDNVLSFIRDVISSPTFAPSSVTSTVNACATTMSAAKFSDLLQTSNIEGHTALHWAIVNNRPETFSALAGFISQFSSDCSSDLRLACMTTNDHALFTRLNLGVDSNDPKDEPLRRSLGYPSDEIQVHESSNRVVARFCIRMFQKRLRTTQNMRYEFIAEGRIWSLRFFILPTTGVWRTELSLSQDSFPARPDAVLVIKARKIGRCSIPHKALKLLLELTRLKSEPVACRSKLLVFRQPDQIEGNCSVALKETLWSAAPFSGRAPDQVDGLIIVRSIYHSAVLYGTLLNVRTEWLLRRNPFVSTPTEVHIGS